ncbi:MAG TPA: helix-turn-helix transcriptional regulator, partial [Steroidobacteraceae bacterium]|nr:helix-turn-helix transcriptional regulator [Steroidobacteraceae bacterium]
TQLSDPEKVGVSRSVISLYELGVNRPGAREILLLCEALKVTPNWLLYGSESPISTTQPSLDFMRGDDLQLSVRLAFAMLALDPPQRDAMASLLFAMATQKLGKDVLLSSLVTMAQLMADELLKKVIEHAGESAAKLTMRELIERFAHDMARQVLTNEGTLRRFSKDDEKNEEYDFDNPPPERRPLKRKKIK